MRPAVTGGGGLITAREHRAAAVEAAEELGDPDLTARVIGAYDVPANWTRSDDPEQAGRVVAAAQALWLAPDPPHDLLAEALWALLAQAALVLSDRPTLERARAALLPAGDELAGAASGLISLGPVTDILAALPAAPAF
ncbi:hypothetical protein [Acrocarpospora catenulata]|uniref:hypothetical protein n=1 Tax=Acrocarpospora catenulata TaxID=2836182 RepID=UPI002023B00B|nr:hypothetical protein [Acrocarpospora catenulata]